jgi:monoamine oxidase
MRRRTLLLSAPSLALASCGRDRAREWPFAWVGADPARGHRLRDAASRPAAGGALRRRADVVVVGAGVAGLAAARALSRRGVDAVHLLELEDQPGGNSRGHSIGAIRCPLGAHYLPLPGPQAVEVAELLHELGLLRHSMGRTVADERHLCHSPQERLFIDGQWHDGVLPPAAAGSSTSDQYRRFAADVRSAQRGPGFAIPTGRAAWKPAHEALDRVTFAHWLDERGLDDPQLRWYLDYACRDDYGAGADTVSAWAGLHYFASRHGFSAPGDEAGERDAVFTWPEGNAWLVERLAAPFLGGRIHTGRSVLRVTPARSQVEVLCRDEASGRAELWTARAAVLAVPLLAAARMLDAPPPALAEAVAAQHQAPWLVANVQLGSALLDRASGAPASWDNVRYRGPSLGYVDAQHQSLQAAPGPTVLTAYWTLAERDRARLLGDDAGAIWARAVVDDLAVSHPDLPGKVRRIDLTRYGHAMSIPVPGQRSNPALHALARQQGRLCFAHADLSGYSVFEEAFAQGSRAGASLRL